MTGTALSNDLLLADTGSIALASLGGTEDAVHHSMSVVPMRLDMLSEVPVINVVGSEISAPTHLRLLVELSVRNPHTDTISVMMCEFDSVYLDPRTPTDRLDFRPQRARPPR
jgi:hypothetical protein